MKVNLERMSILLRQQIKIGHDSQAIIIEPYNEERLGPNSYDVRLGGFLKVYKNFPLDPKKENETEDIIIPEEGYVLQPNVLYLGYTIEKIGSDSFIPMYEGRSSMARLGISSHLSAGFGDIGFVGQFTLEITVVHPVRIYFSMKIGQIYFHHVDQTYNHRESQYSGKYKDQTGPTESKSHLDYK
jgi:dCTP deaminase